MSGDFWSTLKRNIRRLFYDKEIADNDPSASFSVRGSNVAVVNKSNFLKDEKNLKQFIEIAERKVSKDDC